MQQTFHHPTMARVLIVGEDLTINNNGDIYIVQDGPEFNRISALVERCMKTTNWKLATVTTRLNNNTVLIKDAKLIKA